MMQYMNRFFGPKWYLWFYLVSLGALSIKTILIMNYNDHIWLFDYTVVVQKGDMSVPPCYESGMTAFNDTMGPTLMRTDGSFAPPLFLCKERRALRLLLEDIERNGINTGECTYYVVGPVYGLYERMGRWEAAKVFLEHAIQFYEESDVRHGYIQRLIDVIEPKLDQPRHVRMIRRFTTRTHAFVKFYGPFIFYALVLLTSCSFIIALVGHIRIRGLHKPLSSNSQI